MYLGQNSDRIDYFLRFEGGSPPACFVSSPDYENFDDITLLRLFQTGSYVQRQDAFHTIYNRYRMDIFLILKSRGLPLEVVKDLFADTWLVFLKTLPSFVIDGKTKEPFKRFLVSTNSKLCNAHFREKKDAPLYIGDITEELLDKMRDLPEDEFGRTSQLQASFDQFIHPYVIRLKERDRQIFQLYYYKKLNDEEIGKRLGMRPDAVRTARCRITKKLAEMHEEKNR